MVKSHVEWRMQDFVLSLFLTGGWTVGRFSLHTLQSVPWLMSLVSISAYFTTSQTNHGKNYVKPSNWVDLIIFRRRGVMESGRGYFATTITHAFAIYIKLLYTNTILDTVLITKYEYRLIFKDVQVNEKSLFEMVK